MTPQAVIQHFGSITKAATALGIKPPSVSEWLTKGRVPAIRQYQIEQATKGQLRAERPALRESVA